MIAFAVFFLLNNLTLCYKMLVLIYICSKNYATSLKLPSENIFITEHDKQACLHWDTNSHLRIAIVSVITY